MESIDIKKTDKEKIVNTYARYDLAHHMTAKNI